MPPETIIELLTGLFIVAVFITAIFPALSEATHQPMTFAYITTFFILIAIVLKAFK